MKKTSWLFLLLLILILQKNESALAHMAVEDRFYEDVEFSKAKEQIVLLRGLNVIAADSYANLFRPQEKLSRADLAFWSANFRKLAETGAQREQWLQAAKEHGLLKSLEGNATYRDVNQAYFDGKAPLPDNPDGEMNREQFAVYMGQFLTKAVEGKTLYDRAGVLPGPTGDIEKVTKRTNTSAQEDGPQFDMIVAGKSYPLAMHPVILHGSTDLGAWPGMTIGASWLAKGENGSLVVNIINVDAAHPQSPPQDNPPAQAAVANRFPVLPIVGILFLFMLGLQFYLRKRRRQA